MNDISIENRLVEFLRQVTGQTTLKADTELFEAGCIDSLTMMDLLVFIETSLGVRLDFSDLNTTVFRTPTTLAGLIASRLEGAREVQAA